MRVFIGLLTLVSIGFSDPCKSTSINSIQQPCIVIDTVRRTDTLTITQIDTLKKVKFDSLVIGFVESISNPEMYRSFGRFVRTVHDGVIEGYKNE